MKTIATCVEEILVSQPFLEDALTRNILNYSALSEELREPISKMLRKPVKSGAIMMALRRYSPPKEMANKIKLASALKVSMYESGELYKDTIIDVWKKADRGLKNHRKEFDEKKVSLNNLREQYKARGVWWFSTQYGLQDDSDKLAGAKSDDFPEAISSSKKGELKK